VHESLITWLKPGVNETRQFQPKSAIKFIIDQRRPQEIDSSGKAS
jgi:hypothetical protein